MGKQDSMQYHELSEVMVTLHQCAKSESVMHEARHGQ